MTKWCPKMGLLRVATFTSEGTTENINYIKQILFSSILGDGKLELPPRGINARFGFTQAEAQKDYFISVCNSLSTISSAKYREYAYLDKRTGKTYKSLNFWTKSSPMLTEFYNIFYSNKVKIVPSDLSLLTPLALAHWVAQKGLLRNNSLYLCTDGFAYVDVQRLTQYLINRYNIKCTVHKKAKGNYRIYILAKSLQTVKNIISPYKLNKIYECKTDNNLSLKPSLSFNMKRPVVKLLNSSLSQSSGRKFYSTKDNPNSFVPVLKYENADLQKKQVVKENKGRSGVYLWQNNVNGNCYIGSSVDLGRRFKNYFSFNYITKSKSSMLINKALIKYGYYNFSIEILEYCYPSLAISREQYYIDLLKPKYNILKVAGSPLGYKHTEESRSKMGGIRSPEHLEKIISNLKKINTQGFSPEVRTRITQGSVNFNIKTKGKKVIFSNIETEEVLTFVSMRDAALKMSISRHTINKHVLSKEPWGKYIISFII